MQDVGRSLSAILVIGLLVPGLGLLFASPKGPTLPPASSFVLPPGEFYSIPTRSFSNATTVSYQMTSNTTISTAFMTSSQFNSFNNSQSGVSNSVFLSNGTSSEHSFRISEGIYYLIFYAPVHTANVTYSFEILPNNPFQFGQLPAPESLGVASFGLYNSSGSITPYEVMTTEVVGAAGISSMEAYNSSAGESGSNISGATLQLNAVLVVQENGGTQQAYWCQNTPDFVTAANQVSLADNVWNFSVSGFLSNNTISSQGRLGFAYSDNGGPGGSTEYYYTNNPSNSTYSLPFDIALVMNESRIPGTGVLLQMGSEMFQNGSKTVFPTRWFDNITLHDPAVQSSYFLVSGNATTPDGLFYDAEFVFGGEANGESTTFTQMNATMGIYYSPGMGSPFQSFPSLLSVGGDTAESADNLHVSYVNNGLAVIGVGAPTYSYLGQASGTFSLSNPLLTFQPSSAGTTSSTSTVSSSSTASAISSSSVVSASSSVSTTSSSTSIATTSTLTAPSTTQSAGASALSSPTVVLMGGEVAGVAVLALAAYVNSHRKRGEAP